jgi:hypothetical protein
LIYCLETGVDFIPFFGLFISNEDLFGSGQSKISNRPFKLKNIKVELAKAFKQIEIDLFVQVTSISLFLFF